MNHLVERCSQVQAERMVVAGQRILLRLTMADLVHEGRQAAEVIETADVFWREDACRQEARAKIVFVGP